MVCDLRQIATSAFDNRRLWLISFAIWAIAPLEACSSHIEHSPKDCDALRPLVNKFVSLKGAFFRNGWYGPFIRTKEKDDECAVFIEPTLADESGVITLTANRVGWYLTGLDGKVDDPNWTFKIAGQKKRTEKEFEQVLTKIDALNFKDGESVTVTGILCRYVQKSSGFPPYDFGKANRYFFSVDRCQIVSNKTSTLRNH